MLAIWRSREEQLFKSGVAITHLPSSFSIDHHKNISILSRIRKRTSVGNSPFPQPSVPMAFVVIAVICTAKYVLSNVAFLTRFPVLGFSDTP